MPAQLEQDVAVATVANEMSSLPVDRQIARLENRLGERCDATWKSNLTIYGLWTYYAQTFPQQHARFAAAFDGSRQASNILLATQNEVPANRAKIESVSKRWENWDWVVPSNKTPLFWSGALLAKMVTLSVATPDFVDAMNRCAAEVRARLTERSGSGPDARNVRLTTNDVVIVIEHFRAGTTTTTTKKRPAPENGADETQEPAASSSFVTDVGDKTGNSTAATTTITTTTTTTPEVGRAAPAGPSGDDPSLETSLFGGFGQTAPANSSILSPFPPPQPSPPPPFSPALPARPPQRAASKKAGDSLTEAAKSSLSLSRKRARRGGGGGEEEEVEEGTAAAAGGAGAGEVVEEVGEEGEAHAAAAGAVAGAGDAAAAAPLSVVEQLLVAALDQQIQKESGELAALLGSEEERAAMEVKIAASIAAKAAIMKAVGERIPEHWR